MLLSYLHLFGHVKNKLTFKRLATQADVKQAVPFRLQTLNIDLFSSGYKLCFHFATNV